MSQDFVINLFREAFYTTLLLAAPVLLLSMLVGFVISIFQAATSIQEFTLTFVPKLVVVAAVIVLTLPWMMDVMVTFTVNLFHQIPVIGR
jgi:flagellar biosynthetic protein FliQ